MAFDDNSGEMCTAGQVVATSPLGDKIRDMANFIETCEEVKDLIRLANELVQRCEDRNHNNLCCDKLSKR